MITHWTHDFDGEVCDLGESPYDERNVCGHGYAAHEVYID